MSTDFIRIEAEEQLGGYSACVQVWNSGRQAESQTQCEPMTPALWGAFGASGLVNVAEIQAPVSVTDLVSKNKVEVLER